MTIDLHGRGLLEEVDFSKGECTYLIDFAARLRQDKRSGTEAQELVGRDIALILEKTSTRTISAFDVGAYDQGAHVTDLGHGESQIGSKESVKDSARVLGRMFEGIEYRGFAHQSVEILGREPGVPVWNGLTDKWHPTEMLADVLTIRDHTAKPFEDVTYCYLGDARNNTANSLLVTGAFLGAAGPTRGPRSVATIRRRPRDRRATRRDLRRAALGHFRSIRGRLGRGHLVHRCLAVVKAAMVATLGS